MASSEVDMAPSSPFGCVLRDRNRRDGCNRESSNKWRKILAKDQNLHTCIADENENSCWLPNNNIRLSRRKCANSNIKERDNFSSTKVEEMPTTKTETLPRLDNLAPETPNLGAASLVQIWEKRLKRSKKGGNSNSAVLADSGLSCNESNISSSSSSSSSSSPRSLEAEAEDSVLEERFDSLADWHSNRTAPTEQPSPRQSWNSDAGESERVRVADIIKRLASTNQGQSALRCCGSSGNDNGREQSDSPRDCLSPVWSDQMDQRFFSPRIRGRQAFTDLLIRMEKERQGELNGLIERRAVSKFPQKGRIQSMLRLRLLQRGPAVQDRQQPRFTAASQAGKLPQGSFIMHLRERFSDGVEHGATCHRSPGRETTNNTANFKNPSIPNKPDGQIQYQQVNFMDQQDLTMPIQDPPVREIECIHEEPGCLSPVQETITLVQDPPVHNTEDIRKKTGPLNPIQDPPAHNIKDIHEEVVPSLSITWQETSLDCTNFDVQETSSGDRNLASQETAGTTDASTSCGGWDGNDVVEELEENYQEHLKTSYDWISDISRPRSYWEDLRKEWYHEILNSNSDKAEIRQLLERGTVSGFLASDFRKRMDRLMATRLEIGQAQPAGGSQGGEEDEGHSQLLSFIQNHQQWQQQHEIEEEQEQQQEGEKKEESLMGNRYPKAGDYFDQSRSSLVQVPSPTLQRSWSSRDNDFGDDSDRAASTSPRLNFPSQEPYDHTGWQCSSSRNHPSIEMELICVLRGQMEQLHQDMSEIRKSLKSSMDMQMILMQQSVKQDVHSVERERAIRKKGNCFICYEMKIDSLLYRCGHMCTCLKCAHELQWSSGKCPICRAPIVDVVRAFLELDS